MNTAPIKALLAEDEPVLARGLVKTLGRLWPALRIDAVVHDGEAAVQAAHAHLPDVIFMDIQMPERNGLDAAEQIVDDWPADKALPLLVFVTAFDRFAVDAFERAAVDYVLKPVEPERMGQTCQRLIARLAERAWQDSTALAPLKALLSAQPTEAPLQLIQAGIGSTLHMVPVADVHYFEADDKYVRVVTHDRALLIRTPLRELLPQLDATQFTQIHRGTVVRTTLIDRVVREDAGKILLYLKGRTERLTVSRSHAHLFKPM
jgi:DNA-binding LytR/AlgR family response regulator